MGEEGRVKLGRKGRAVLIGFWALFFISRFSVIRYGDTRILIFGISNLLEFIHQDKEALVVGSYTLRTEHGPVHLKPFCMVEIMSNKIWIIARSGKRLSHDLRVLESKLDEDIFIYFYDNEEVIEDVGPGTIAIDGVEVYAALIHFYRNKTISFIEIPIFDLTVLLSDGTEIKPDRATTVYLCFNENETWSLEFGYYAAENHDFLVKRAGQEEYEKYKTVDFKAHWGDFIGGELYEGRR
jgi:hypothetical protein